MKERHLKASKTDIKELQARKVIPMDTPYCYTWKDDKFYCCPYYKSIPNSSLYGGCRLIKSIEILDQIKSCGINCNY